MPTARRSRRAAGFLPRRHTRRNEWLHYGVWAAIACAGLLAAPAPGLAQTGWFELVVPGSLDLILGGEDSRSTAEPVQPERFRQPPGPRLLRDLIGVFHDPDSTAANSTEVGAFRSCLGDLQRLRTRWRAVDRTAGEVSLRTATGSRDGRRALASLLDLFDLHLRRDDSVYRVTTRRQEPRALCGAGRRWRSDEVERRLNAGETLAWDVPYFVVSLPLSPGVWLELLHDERIEDADRAAAQVVEMAADLVGRLVTDVRAAQLYLGLAALDERTLTWLARRPRAVSRLDGAGLSAFARFGGALRVHDGEVRAPGGAEAVPFWERLVGAAPSDPERFVGRLFTRSSGRVAQAYHLVAGLSEPQQRFVLGSWRTDPRDRQRGQAELQRVLERLPSPASVFANPGAAPRADVAVAARVPGEHVCGIPPDEAIAIAWDVGNTGVSLSSSPGVRPNPNTPPFFACSALQCSGLGRTSELSALEDVGVDITHRGFRFACRVQARMPFPSPASAALLVRLPGEREMEPASAGAALSLPYLPARMYRLGYKSGPSLMQLREFIR